MCVCVCVCVRICALNALKDVKRMRHLLKSYRPVSDP